MSAADRYPFDEGHEDYGFTWDDDLSSAFEPRVDIPEVVRKVYKDEDKTIYLTAASIGVALLAGYTVKRKLKKRKQ